MTSQSQRDTQRPIIITAMARSGTTLLKALLNCSPQLYIASFSQLPGVLQAPDASAAIDATLAREFAETGRSRAQLDRALRALLFAFWTDTGEAESLGKRATERWGFLVYEPAAFAAPVRALFPAATWLHAVRDGRDVIASWLANWHWLEPPFWATGMFGARRQQSRGERLQRLAQLWVASAQAAQAICSHTIRLEDLSAPGQRETRARALFADLQLPYPEQAAAFLAELPWLNEQRRAHQRWRDELDGAAIKVVMQVPGFAETLGHYGYPLA